MANERQTFPALYKDDRQWEVWVERRDVESVVVRRYGKRGGKLTTTERKVTAGKNVGKSNETTVFEQACREAGSYWTKQRDTHGYRSSENENNETLPIAAAKPMLAKTYEPSTTHDTKPKKKGIRFPCYTQPKLDGVRLVVFRGLSSDSTDSVILRSRTGKEMDHPNLKHIKARCEAVLKRFKPGTVLLDGELYSPDVPFEEIVSLCRNKSAYTSDRLDYHVYDVFLPEAPDTTFEDRLAFLREHLGPSSLTLVDTQVCESPPDVLRAHKHMTTKQGFEGVMLRNGDGVYVPGKRSDDLQKYKTFLDQEFPIVSVKEGLGKDEGTAVLECAVGPKTFWVRPTGPLEWRRHLLKDAKNVVGKKLTVCFQEYTDQGIPRFPVGKCIRDYE
jgi:DNA ligase-1